MSHVESRQVGNIFPADIHAAAEYGSRGSDQYGPSLAEEWERQGIQYEFTDPVPTEEKTIEQLKAIGMVGLTLHVPKP